MISSATLHLRCIKRPPHPRATIWAWLHLLKPNLRIILSLQRRLSSAISAKSLKYVGSWILLFVFHLWWTNYVANDKKTVQKRSQFTFTQNLPHFSQFSLIFWWRSPSFLFSGVDTYGILSSQRGITLTKIEAKSRHSNLLCGTLKQSHIQNLNSICQSM